MKTEYLYINTIGCQMNVYDSEQIAKGLASLKYKTTPSLKKADLIIINTCTIREKAEQKVFSFLGRLASLKQKNPNLIIGVGGCVAQQEGKKILERAPYVDLVFGTYAISRLPRLIEQVKIKRYRIVDVEMYNQTDEIKSVIMPCKNNKAADFVTIMQGCDNYCTYCVVPYVRGREISKKPNQIIKEIKNLVASGVKEITLLGQNVNSYGKKQGLCSFAELLSQINDIKGLLRIRFTTSHPKDLSDDLILCFKNLERLCNHIHLPVQSGSDRILKKMNRKYTNKQYLGIIDKLRKASPNIAITSDIIIGFPSETDTDYKETLDLIKRVEFDGLFAFKYSDRPNTSSASFPEKVLEDVKKERLSNLLEVQAHFTAAKNLAYVGSTESILVEGLSKKQNEKELNSLHKNVQWTGRTTTNKIVNFACDEKTFTDRISTGKLIDVKILKAFSHSLWGKAVIKKPEAFGLKGESYAA